MSFGDLQALLAWGVPIRAVATVAPALTRITLNHAGDRYEPDPDGRPAYVFPATIVDPIWPELLETLNPREIVSCGHIVDLVACHPAAPSRWALRTGQAIALGAIEHQYWFPMPTPVHRTVISWLRAGCVGIVLLTNNPFEASQILRGIATIVAEDEEHAGELREILKTPTPIRSTVVVHKAVAA
jgi:hypothetical protein